ncbi:MAG: bifunctional phosphoribosyl-AMP cyclohydrolase/phosphoribosyl-ATP diphosphatase HisIE [Hyphomonadaceae bacterium]|nr:bifunctional phosphoribosyl-AMP cyclohydrolase/phosphoribosyl-ATP diphosphatase HisIE [Hyphomonadaceae bacterium]
MTSEEIARVDFEKGGGLVPVIVQDFATQQVLMLAYMNRDALAETQESGEATFYSRSRGGRWRKGETSGNIMKVRGIQIDCDGDTLLLRVEPAGPACHLGTVTCFGDKPALGVGQLAVLERTVAVRAGASPDESWTAKLLALGQKRIAQKVGEEGVETALAGASGGQAELADEMADLFYHCLVLLHARSVPLEAVMDVLARRASESKK